MNRLVTFVWLVCVALHLYIGIGIALYSSVLYNSCLYGSMKLYLYIGQGIDLLYGSCYGSVPVSGLDSIFYS